MLGSNQWRDMQGAEIAQKHHIVVVSVAYRLGVFGYMHNKARRSTFYRITSSSLALGVKIF